MSADKKSSTESSEYEKIKKVFAGALEIPLESRAEFLDKNCPNAEIRREVDSLLAAHQEADNFLNDVSAVEVIQNTYQQSSSLLGQKIGKYRIEREIGRGGMGIVFLATREDFRQQVALKIIKRGMDSEAIIERFAREREILASLNHPFIARLLDGGTTDDGLPFFVMEYVEGETVDEYCRRKNLSENARLELFRKICAAVQFAHQKLIVHRDLKPSNILVTEDGTPKLLDFGIAKLLTSEAMETQTQQRVLTPAYASPEQMRGEIVGTTSDVYSLGLILSKMLGVSDSKSQISDSSKPNQNLRTNKQQTKTKSQNLNNDLSNIIKMSLREDATRRYGSCEAFSEDIRRYLEGLPISARKDSRFYRASKFIKRNRAAVAVFALFILSLLGGLAATAWEWRIAKRERAVAEERFEALRKSSSSMIGEINGALMDLPSSAPARKLLLERAMEQLDILAASSENNPQLQNDLGDAYQNLNYLPDKTLDERIDLLNRSMNFYGQVIASDAKNPKARKGLAIDNVNLADIAREQGDIPKASEHNRQAIELLEGVIADEPENIESQTDLWNVYYNAALTLNLQGRAADSLEICRRMTPLAEKLAKEKPVDLSGNEFRRPYLGHGLASADLIYLGRYDEALSEINTAIEANKQQRAAHPDSIYARLDEAVFKERLAKALEGKGNFEEALKTMRESLEISEKLAAENAKDNYYLSSAASTKTHLAQMLIRAGKFSEAIPYFQNAIKTDEEILAKDAKQKQAKFNLAAAYGGLGKALAQTGKNDEGLANEQKALDIYREINAASSADSVLRHDFAQISAQTAENFIKKNEAERAKSLFQQSYDILSRMREQGTLSAVDAELLAKIAARLKV
jgi:serine/threonine protein kinase